VTKSPVKLSDLFRYYKQLPHQMAAIIELEAALLKVAPDAFNKDQPWFKTWSQAGKQPDPIYLAPALRIIKEFEGCHHIAYADPVGVWTIGWGNTQIDGRPVKQGDKITQSTADTMLRDSVEQFAAQLYTLIPAAKNYGGNQQAALLSWLYNVGGGAASESTLRRRINAGESAQVVIPQELPKWDKANGRLLAGLTRRRAAEVTLFTGHSAPRFAPSSPFTTLITPHITYGEICLNEERRRFASQAQCDICMELCIFIEKARAQFGNKPIIITSGNRPENVNQAVGGASNSEHLYKPGCGAIDWYISSVPVRAVQDWCDAKWPFSLGYGATKGFIHLGIRAGRPRVRWDY
jgi:GH24 family phage-related lysozyme (muramidase)